jgi:ABC-type transport system involved in cytochrome c biogenesis permease subunit
MIGFLHGLALGFYLVSAVGLYASFAEGRPAPPRSPLLILAASVLAHLAGLIAFTVTYGQLPLSGLGPALSTFTLLLGAALLAGTLRREGRPIGLVLAPLCAALLGVALVIGIVPSAQPLAFGGAWFGLHVMLAFLAYACLALAFAAGLLYLMQFRQLKEKRFGRVFRYFPSLTTLDMVGRRAIAIGFPALTLGIVLGFAWTLRTVHSLPITDPQVIWGVLSWFVFFALLVVRMGGAGRERRAAWASVVGFLVVVAAYVVLRVSMTTGGTFL